MTDEMIVALAKKGGVVQINFSCGFLKAGAGEMPGGDAAVQERIQRESANLSGEQRLAVVAKIRADMGSKAAPRATLADVVAHIDHIKQVAGVGAVGIGSDFDGVGCTPEGLDDVSKFPNLTRALLEKGYSADDIRNIYGGNLLRVMRGVEAAAEK
jgi:membrane dipeptidase